MPEQAAQQPARTGGIGVWLNRLFLGFCIYVLIFGNPLKSFMPDGTNLNAATNGTLAAAISAPKVETPTTRSGKHVPLVLAGAKLVRSMTSFDLLPVFGVWGLFLSFLLSKTNL
jgi:hypothetical protein